MVVFRHLPYGMQPAIRILPQQSQGQGHPLQGAAQREGGSSANRYRLCPLLPLARLPPTLPEENQRLREEAEKEVNGKDPYNFLFGDVRSLDFSDASKVFVNFYDNTFAGYPLSDVKSFRFYNRWSNPDVLLKAQYS